MSALSLGTRGKIMGFARYIEAVPNLVQLFESIENWAKHIGNDNIDDLSITTAKLASQAVTQAKVADGVGQANSGQFTGDGTADRIVAVGFRPRHVRVFRHDTSMFFESIGNVSSALFAGRRDSTGTWTGSGVLDAEFQGVTATGFTLGHAAGGGLSNASGKTYSWFAEK